MQRTFKESYSVFYLAEVAYVLIWVTLNCVKSGEVCTPSLFFLWLDSPSGPSLLIVEVSRPHSDAPYSVGLLHTSDQPYAETSTWQNITLTRDRHPCPGGIRTSNPSKQTHALNRAATVIGLYT
jgi:hypothetical protein